MQDLTVALTGGRLNIRVAAIIRDQDKILVSKWPDGTISLVGGRVAYGETAQAAISREVTEETGLAVKSAQLHAIIEMIAMQTISLTPFQQFFYKWPRNFTIALLTEMLIAQPIARWVMHYLHKK